MITAKDVILREYKDKECVAFAILLKTDKKHFAARYEKIDDKTWGFMITLVDYAKYAAPQVYAFKYSVPKNNMPLEMIAAIGLSYWQDGVMEEVQLKNELVFKIGEMVNGNIG